MCKYILGIFLACNLMTVQATAASAEPDSNAVRRYITEALSPHLANDRVNHTFDKTLQGMPYRITVDLAPAIHRGSNITLSEALGVLPDALIQHAITETDIILKIFVRKSADQVSQWMVSSGRLGEGDSMSKLEIKFQRIES
jgi:hypothetical protein